MFTLRFYYEGGVHVVHAPHYSIESSQNTSAKVVTVYPNLTTEQGVEYQIAGANSDSERAAGLPIESCIVDDENGRVVDTVHHILGGTVAGLNTKS